MIPRADKGELHQSELHNLLLQSYDQYGDESQHHHSEHYQGESPSFGVYDHPQEYHHEDRRDLRQGPSSGVSTTFPETVRNDMPSHLGYQSHLGFADPQGPMSIDFEYYHDTNAPRVGGGRYETQEDQYW